MSDLGLKDASSDVRDDPDGIVRVVIHGEVSEDRVRAVLGAIRRVAESGRDVLVLADARHMGPISASARKAVTEEVRSTRVDAVAMIGASFSMRVIVALLAKGVQMLTGQPYPQQFFDTEGEAHAWLLARRDALRAGRGPGTPE
ncbi:MULTISPECIES: STAS/SEC14 domain-containing protein [Sorangium]|uniref:STAS/SEC14 domain-containing protein n=1 Tax=Sorangium atrum TaxID=2995308 RepID=A0ABT5C2Y9_9BACT|nr:STAS/SEC14 domain-containing protein [Sorangium aterium]MDC0680777.1 STAS/SEC14 domain-containing protein [Sorangium aterium]